MKSKKTCMEVNGPNEKMCAAKSGGVHTANEEEWRRKIGPVIVCRW